jgi:hypothetical protein
MSVRVEQSRLADETVSDAARGIAEPGVEEASFDEGELNGWMDELLDRR